MNKKIEWIKRGMTANNGLHMQEVCDKIADATAAINNSLQKPTTAPSATQIVTVDNTNTQTMLNIGDGLSVENGSLKASGGGGGTGGKKYFHQILLSDPNFTVNIGLFIVSEIENYATGTSASSLESIMPSRMLYECCSGTDSSDTVQLSAEYKSGAGFHITGVEVPTQSKTIYDFGLNELNIISDAAVEL